MLKSRNSLQLMLRWKCTKPKKRNTDRALENFDNFYGTVFGIRWKNIRAALLTEHKYVAMVNNFGDTEYTCAKLENDGAINMKSLVEINFQKMSKSDILKTEMPDRVLGDKVKDLVRDQVTREIQSLYPEREIPAEIDHHQPSHSSDQALLNKIDQFTGDIICLDEKRLIDPEKGTAALHEYVPADKIKGMDDWIPESEHYRYYQTTTDFPLKFELETNFIYPSNLALYTYEIGNCSEFRPPHKCLTGVLSHYLLDGASVLAPLLLGVEKGDRVMDACAAPGGKSLLMLQTLHPSLLICNDIMESRVSRLRKVMQEYLFDYSERWDGKRVLLEQCDARNLQEYGTFDKVLIDVPCTSDRHSLMESDNNIFKPTRIKERLRLPQLQADILANCMRLLKEGGSLVYSTCTLSPVQNDGVVHMALQKVFNDFGLTFTIKDLSQLIHLFTDIYRFEYSKSLKYGQMVTPHLTANFGPMYICKITRDEC